MLKKLHLLLVAIIILAAGSTAFSQDSNRLIPPRPATQNQKAETFLVALEEIPKRILETRIFRKQDADDFKNIAARYAEAYINQREYVLNANENTAITQGRRENTNLLEDFEKFAENHAGRLLAMSDSLVEIGRAVETGEIIVSPDNEQSSYSALMEPRKSEVKSGRSSFDFTGNVFGANLNEGGCSSVNNFSSANLLAQAGVVSPRLIPIPNPLQECVRRCYGDWHPDALQCLLFCLLSRL